MKAAVAARWQEIAPLLDRLLDVDAAQRDALLADVADDELRGLLRDLLAREARRGFLDGDSADYADSLIGSVAAAPAQIGPYRVLDLIGEGGSGSVYRAEREVDGYVQRVAVKLLRVGLRDPAEQARFRRERRILARLEHPSIARLIDGGFTADGVPWFALEYVEGEDIVRWCDTRRLRVDARLRLFAAVCDAVEAAHRALIVHRDIKPANILVDAAGRPRLLDFGIAKLLDDSERDDDTRTGLRRLTPAYAAPEQFSGGALTTATDVYALGVLLHELLTGQRPGLPRGETPRRPSQLVTQDAVAAATRATSARQLAQSLRGDLDVIVATALAAEPARRYASVAAFAADVRAHLERRPIAARGASALHRTMKFVQRHRVGLAAVVLVVATALAGIVATWRESQRANRAAADALAQAQRAEAVKDFVLALFAGVSPDESKGRDVSARELIERGEARLAETLATHPELHSQLATALAGAHRQLGALERASVLADAAVAAAAEGTVAAAARIERARVRLAQAQADAAQADLQHVLADSSAAALHGEAQRDLAIVLVEKGDAAAAQQALRLALDRTRGEQGEASRLRDLAALGPVQFRAGDVAGAEESLRDALALSLRLHGTTHTQTAGIRHDLGVILLQRGVAAGAAEQLTAAESVRRQLLGERHPDYAQTVFNLAVARQRLGDSSSAATLYERALDVQRATLGPDHPDVANSLNSLAVLAWSQGDVARAIERMNEALATARRAHGEQHPSVATMLGSLGGFERYSGRLDAALAHSEQGLAIVRTALGERHYLAGIAGIGVAATQNERGDGAAALASYREALAVLDATLGSAHADTQQSRAAYADVLLASGDAAAAAREIDSVLATPAAALPAGHPRRARLELVKARIAVSRGDCGAARGSLEAIIASLAKGGMALLPDLASAQALQARCADAQSAAAMAAGARASAARLPYVPRRLRAEIAALR